jgi:prepilin-type N-terminal cleavage/methylation domain-containing protein
MMFHRIGSINKNQKGFTLLEMVLALLIGGLMAGGITAAIFQVVLGSARTNNHMTAVRQVESAGYWVSHDAQMAQTVAPARDADGFPLTLSWKDWDDTVNTVTYTIEDGDLKRTHIAGSQTSTTTVARFIVLDSAKTRCQLAGGGAFTLPDNNDAFTISGAAVADSGQITLVSGTISVTTTGGATYSATTGTWTTPAAGGTVVVRATASGTGGRWTSNAASATAAITTDSDGDATLTRGVLLFTVTAAVGPSSQRQTETRIYEIIPRPGS